MLAVFGELMVLCQASWLLFPGVLSLAKTSTPYSKDYTISTRSILAPLRAMSHTLRDTRGRNMACPDAELPQSLLDRVLVRL